MKRTFSRFAFSLIAVVALCATATDLAARPWWRTQPEEEVLLSLPLDPARAARDWESTDAVKPVSDDILGVTVLEALERHTDLRSKVRIAGPFEISARVRIVPQGRISHAAALFCGVRGPENAFQYAYGLFTSLSTLRGTPTLSISGLQGNDYHRLLPPADPASSPGALSLSLRPRFTDISPVWDPDFRREIESAMAGVPQWNNTWFSLRVVVRDDAVKMYKDGLLIGQYKPAAAAEGAVILRLQPGVRVANLTVRRVEPRETRYEPVALEGLCNAGAVGARSAFAIDPVSVPLGGTDVRVEDIPFHFPARVDGTDHVDVGASLFHYRMQEGAWNMRYLWPSIGSLDPARIRFTVPNRPYSKLWLIAAADGDPDSIPLVTVRFYRPAAGFTIDAKANAPALTGESRPAEAEPLDVDLPNGERGRLWLIPVELDSQRISSELREFNVLSVELTKKVYGYRAYPDPGGYGYFQGGLPSSVRIFAMTFDTAPVTLRATGNRPGNAYVLPERPVWQVRLSNQGDDPVSGVIRVALTDPYGKVERTLEKEVQISPCATSDTAFPIETEKHGLYGITTEFEATRGVGRDRCRVLTSRDRLVQMPYDTRRAKDSNSRWGLWTWYGGHGTNPDDEENSYLLRAAGARGVGSRRMGYRDRRRWGLFQKPNITVRGIAPWARKDPYDPAEYEAFSETIGKSVAEKLKENPDGTYFCFFGERSVSMEATYGTYPEYIGEGRKEWTDEEQESIRAYMLTAEAGMKGVRKYAPKAKIALGWCSQLFSVPFMREGFPPDLFDAIGIDFPTFERMPEMPPYDIAPNRMWYLKQEMERLGYDKEIVDTETYFPSSHELALGQRVSADYYVRLAVLSLALGTDRLYNCFSLHDCSDYWGSQHYGCIGIVGRKPEFNPKPAFPAYATMTRLLDLVDFDGFVPTASISSYCVAFRNLDSSLPWSHVYCLWTIRGERNAVLTFASDANATLVDENSNESPLPLVRNRTQVTLGPTPSWITSDQPIERMDLLGARYEDTPPPHTHILDTFDAPWVLQEGDYEPYSQHYPVRYRTYPAKMRSEIVGSVERDGTVWRVSLETPEVERRMAARYAVYKPTAPITIPGKARALGVWVNGHSDWGRIVYEIRDAKGETFISLGKTQTWNANDNHQWSYFNFDGWRYVEFPLPNNLPGDGYRQKDNVWWGYDHEGIVDLPVTLTRIIIEHRTHNIYVDKLFEATNPTVELDDLTAVYESEAMMSSRPVALQQRAHIAFESSGEQLPNPYERLKESGTGDAAQIKEFARPEDWYDGTQIVVQMAPQEGAVEYRVYVSAYPGGAGASMMAKGDAPQVQVNRLRPEFPLYLFATTVDEKQKESKPSAIRRLTLKDDFPFK